MKIFHQFTGKLIFDGGNLHGKDLSFANLKSVDLSNCDIAFANLSYADLSGANLSGTNLGCANLSFADLSDTCLSKAYLGKADLSNACIKYADLSDADLSYADLHGADLCRASLLRANLSSANLSSASIRGALMREAELNDANLDGIKYDGLTVFFGLACPEEGEFIAWKRVGDYIVKLLIPACAKRSSATTRKCRASKAHVLGIFDVEGNVADVITVTSSSYTRTEYTVGEDVLPDEWDDNRWNECSHGIHFFITRGEAINY